MLQLAQQGFAQTVLDDMAINLAAQQLVQASQAHDQLR